MRLGFEFFAAKPKVEVSNDDAPTQVPMKAAHKELRNPTTDQKKVRRAMQRKTAAGPEDRCYFCGESCHWESSSVGDYFVHDETQQQQCPDGSGNMAEPATETYDGVPSRFARKETAMKTEAELLRAMASANYTEQKQIMEELNRVRAQRTASIQADRENDFSTGVTQLQRTAGSYGLTRTASDWMLEDEETPAEFAAVSNRVVTEANLWFTRTSAEVQADAEEFTEQAKGAARRVASMHAEHFVAAERTFMDQAEFLRKRHTAAGAYEAECSVCGVLLVPEDFYSGATEIPKAGDGKYYCPDHDPDDPYSKTNSPELHEGSKTANDVPKQDGQNGYGESKLPTPENNKETVDTFFPEEKPFERGSDEVIEEAQTKDHNTVAARHGFGEGEGAFKAQFAGVGEDVWSGNGITFDTKEEATEYAKSKLFSWTGADVARVVPTATPTWESVDLSDSQIVQNYRTGSRVAGSSSDKCPDCGAKTEPEINGDTLTAECDSCGWIGTKTKTASEQDGHGESNAPKVDPLNPDTMWPVELTDEEKKALDAANVAGVPTPGGAAGYPQPTASKVASDDAPVTYKGEPYYHGSVDSPAKLCQVCGREVSNAQVYVTAWKDGEDQKIIDAWCGLDIQRGDVTASRRPFGKEAAFTPCDRELPYAENCTKSLGHGGKCKDESPKTYGSMCGSTDVRNGQYCTKSQGHSMGHKDESPSGWWDYHTIDDRHRVSRTSTKNSSKTAAVDPYDLNEGDFKAALEAKTTPADVLANAGRIYDFMSELFDGQETDDSVMREWTFQWWQAKTGGDYDTIYNKWLSESRYASKTAKRISLTNVGVENVFSLKDGEAGIGKGTDSSGNKVRFHMSAEDVKQFKSIMLSDLGMNFSGVDIDESEIISEGSRTAASEGQSCKTCGHPIERDPEGETNRTWHHNDGDKHDHEASPSGSTEATRKTASRPLHQIADDIADDWGGKVYFGAKPYLEAMYSLNSIQDMYWHDSADSIVRYFLSNATTWRGEKAREIKAELKSMLKTGAKIPVEGSKLRMVAQVIVPDDVGARDVSPQEIARQIGPMNIMAISGGRVTVINKAGKPCGIQLPVSNGYAVNVFLANNDTYTVQRTYRGNVKGEVTDVYLDEVGEQAYQASSFRSYDYPKTTASKKSADFKAKVQANLRGAK